MNILRTMAPRVTTLAGTTFFMVAFILGTVFVAPVSAELADDTGEYGVSGVDTDFGRRPLASVAAMETIGNTVYVGGKFLNVTRDGTVIDTDQPYLAAFDATTGAYLPNFDPELDGPVNALSVLDGQLLIGGQFETVNGSRRTGLALLDPTDGDSLDLPFSVNGGSPANVRGFDLLGDHLYVAGSFDRAVGPNGSLDVSNAARFHLPSNTVDTAFVPFLTDSAWSIAADSDNSRVYVASFQAGGLITLDITSGETLQAGFVGGSINKPYDVVVHRGKVWIAGAEHALFALDAETLTVERFHYAGRAGQADPWNGGEFQALEVAGDRVYASCHCNYEMYLVGENIRRPISFLVAFDADTGLHIPSFDPHISANSGPWAITVSPDGCVWTGGDLRKSGAQQVEGFARLCEVIPDDPAQLIDLAPSATFSSGAGYFDLDLGTNAGISHVDVDGDIGDHVILISEWEFPVGRTGPEMSGAEGYHGTRVITSVDNNRNYFHSDGRYVRIYTDAAITLDQIAVAGTPTATPDTERPTTPRGLTLTPSDTAITLDWQPATDNIAVTGYDIWRAPTPTGPFTLVGTSATTTYTDTNLTPDTYSYYLKATDAAANTSWRTGSQTTTSGPTPDTERPTTPRGLTLDVAEGQTATFTWTAASDNIAVTGYQLYVDGDPLSASPGTTATLANLPAGTTVVVWVKAFDDAGNTSWRSNSVSIVVP